jgi:hypothetical protein
LSGKYGDIGQSRADFRIGLGRIFSGSFLGIVNRAQPRLAIIGLRLGY